MKSPWNFSQRTHPIHKCWPHLFGFTGKCKGSFRWCPFQTKTTVSLVMDFPLFSYLQSFFWFWVVLTEYFYTLVFIWLLGTRWSGLHGMVVATSWWACTHFCDSLNKSLGWIILLTLRTVVWSTGCRLILFGHVGRCGVLKLFIYTTVLLYDLCAHGC